MKRLLYSFFVMTLLIGLVVIPAGASSMGFYITSVDPNSSVTIHTYGFPEGANMTVTMGPAGSAGLGYYVTTTYTGEGGVLDRTFAIPAALSGLNSIVLRLETADGEYVAYGPFVNQVGGASKPASGTVAPSGSSKSTSDLQLYVEGVDPDKSVSVRTNNFPQGTHFNVYMGKHGTNGVNGVLVQRTFSGDGGSFGVIYTIPSQLYGQSIIDLLMVGEDSAGSVSVAFYNKSGGGAAPSTGSGSASTGGSTSGSTGGTYVSYVPTFSIVSVKPGESVTIRTYNFPPAQAFTVRMGPLWHLRDQWRDRWHHRFGYGRFIRGHLFDPGIVEIRRCDRNPHGQRPGVLCLQLVHQHGHHKLGSSPRGNACAGFHPRSCQPPRFWLHRVSLLLHRFSGG